MTLRGALELQDPARVGRELGAQVGEVLLRTARGEGPAAEGGEHFALAQRAAGHQRAALKEDPFLLDAAAEGRHGAGRAAADIGVVGARGDVEIRPAVPPMKTGVTTVMSGRCVPPW